MPSVGPSPSPAVRQSLGQARHNNDFRSEVESELDFADGEDDEVAGDERGGGGENLCDRLDLPHGVKGVESCRSAMSSDLDFDYGDSCGSFEFLGRGNASRRPRRPSTLADDSIQEETGDDELDDEEDEEEKLFLPRKGAAHVNARSFPDEAEVLRQIQELGAAAAGRSSNNSSRKSSLPSRSSLEKESHADQVSGIDHLKSQ